MNYLHRIKQISTKKAFASIMAQQNKLAVLGLGIVIVALASIAFQPGHAAGTTAPALPATAGSASSGNGAVLGDSTQKSQKQDLPAILAAIGNRSTTAYGSVNNPAPTVANSVDSIAVTTPPYATVPGPRLEIPASPETPEAPREPVVPPTPVAPTPPAESLYAVSISADGCTINTRGPAGYIMYFTVEDPEHTRGAGSLEYPIAETGLLSVASNAPLGWTLAVFLKDPSGVVVAQTSAIVASALCVPTLPTLPTL